MASSVNPNEPKEGLTYTADTRLNFQHTKDEIESLQAKDASQDTTIAGKEPANANIQAHVTATGNAHAMVPGDIGLGNVDNTADVNKPVSNPTQVALNGKKDDFSENAAFNKNYGTALGTVSQGNHGHTAAEVGAAPASHVADSSHLTSDERAAMTQASPTGADPLITQTDLDAHTANQNIHINPNQNDALDGANNPSSSNVFATIADVGGGSGHTIQDPSGTPVADQPNLQFTGDVEVTDDAGNNRTVVNVTAGAGSGEANTGSNIGTGIEVFSSKVALDLQFRKLNESGGGMNIVQNAQDITFSLNYAGNGAANTLARSDHDHNADYLALHGTSDNSLLLNGKPDTDFALDAELDAHKVDGYHVPAGGTQGQFLSKATGDDFDSTWNDQLIVGFGSQTSYNWNTATSGDPGAGNVLVNNVDPTAATAMHVSHTSAGGNVLDFLWVASSTGDITGFEETEGDHETALYRVTGQAVNQGAYTIIPVSYFGGSGSPENGNAGQLSIAVAPANKLPPGGTPGQALAKTGTSDYEVSWGTINPGAVVFTELLDVQQDYSGHANKVVSVNAGEDGLEFTAAGTPNLTDAVFPTYATFAGEIDNAGSNPLIDFTAGNKQTASASVPGDITLRAPGQGTFRLKVLDSSGWTKIEGEAPSGTTWVGGTPVGVAGKLLTVGCDYDETYDEWTLCGSVEE